MMHSPQAMTLARMMGEHFRYQSAIGRRLTELAILVVARDWSQAFEWQAHYPLALEEGLARAHADAIGDGRRPVGLSEAEAAIYDFVVELLRHRRVADETFARVKALFGEQGVVDLTGIVGYYSFLAMQLNVARFPVDRDGPQLPLFPDRAE